MNKFSLYMYIFLQHNHMVIGLRDHTLISMNLEAIPYHEDHSDIPTEASAGIPVLNAAAYKLKDSTVFENSAHKVRILPSNVPQGSHV